MYYHAALGMPTRHLYGGRVQGEVREFRNWDI
jgi:hypothetical protein